MGLNNITIRNNTSWEYRALDRIYYPKCYITGTTRKGTTVTEAIPLRYNGTFKTIILTYRQIMLTI